jgi:hypothetical protein
MVFHSPWAFSQVKTLLKTTTSSEDKMILLAITSNCFSFLVPFFSPHRWLSKHQGPLLGDRPPWEPSTEGSPCPTWGIHPFHTSIEQLTRSWSLTVPMSRFSQFTNELAFPCEESESQLWYHLTGIGCMLALEGEGVNLATKKLNLWLHYLCTKIN